MLSAGGPRMCFISFPLKGPFLTIVDTQKNKLEVALVATLTAST